MKMQLIIVVTGLSLGFCQAALADHDTLIVGNSNTAHKSKEERKKERKEYWDGVAQKQKDKREELTKMICADQAPEKTVINENLYMQLVPTSQSSKVVCATPCRYTWAVDLDAWNREDDIGGNFFTFTVTEIKDVQQIYTDKNGNFVKAGPVMKNQRISSNKCDFVPGDGDALRATCKIARTPYLANAGDNSDCGSADMTPPYDPALDYDGIGRNGGSGSEDPDYGY